MDGIDWVALPVVAEMLGIEDIDWLVSQLVTIRDFHRARK